MLINHLYIFIYFCSFCNWVIFLLLNYEGPGNISLLDIRLANIFFQPVVCLFINSVTLRSTEASNEIQFLNISFMDFTFGFLSMNSLSNLRS